MVPRGRLAAIVLQRCPRCRDGRLFKTLFRMYDPCPVCGLILEREPGYYFGAMYFSYGMSVAILVPFYFLFQWLLPSWSEFLIVPLAAVAYLPFVPLVFRYSRVLWIHWDRYASPSEASTHRGWVEWRRTHSDKDDGKS
jgi:uncharacterized protein (DUF983 family)